MVRRASHLAAAFTAPLYTSRALQRQLRALSPCTVRPVALCDDYRCRLPPRRVWQLQAARGWLTKTTTCHVTMPLQTHVPAPQTKTE